MENNTELSAETARIESRRQLINWILLISCAVIWGFSYFLIKHALVGFEPMEVAGIRMFAGGIALLPFLYQAFKKIPYNKYFWIFVCSLIGSGIPIYLYPLAQTHISSSVTGIINSLTPLFTFMIGVLFFKMKNHYLKVIGVVLGLFGAIALVVFKPSADFSGDGLFFLIALSVPVMYGFSSNILKRHLQGLPSLPLTSLMYFMLIIPAAFYLYHINILEKINTNTESLHALPYAVLLGVFGTAVAMSLFNILIQRTQIMFAASVTYLMPVVAVFIGFVDHETISWYHMLGLSLILVGVILINRAKEKVA
jgi:drug/metabolite transporter (DMT)-like permease